MKVTAFAVILVSIIAGVSAVAMPALTEDGVEIFTLGPRDNVKHGDAVRIRLSLFPTPYHSSHSIYVS